MQGPVHFIVGVCGMLLILIVKKSDAVLRDVPLMFLSGVWATIPDWWWFLTDRFFPAIQAPELGYAIRNRFHRSIVANVFWFHLLLDNLETGNKRLQLLVALSGLGILGSIYLYQLLVR